MNNQLNTISFNSAPSPFEFNHPMNAKVPLNQKFEKSLKEEGKDENIKNQAEKKR